MDNERGTWVLQSSRWETTPSVCLILTERGCSHPPPHSQLGIVPPQLDPSPWPAATSIHGDPPSLVHGDGEEGEGQQLWLW